MEKHYRKRLADHKSNQGGSQQKAHVAYDSKKESTFYAFMAKRPVDHAKYFVWHIDFGASQHFTHRRDWFMEHDLLRFCYLQ